MGEYPGEIVDVWLHNSGEEPLRENGHFKCSADRELTMGFINRSPMDVYEDHHLLLVPASRAEDFIRHLQSTSLEISDIKKFPEIIACLEAIVPGDLQEITFKVPEAGEYAYIYTMPGYPKVMGFRGRMIAV